MKMTKTNACKLCPFLAAVPGIWVKCSSSRMLVSPDDAGAISFPSSQQQQQQHCTITAQHFSLTVVNKKENLSPFSLCLAVYLYNNYTLVARPVGF